MRATTSTKFAQRAAAVQLIIDLPAHEHPGRGRDQPCAPASGGARNGEDLCVFDEVNLNKSKSFTKVLKNIAEAEYEEVLWTFDPTGTWKIFQVRVYEYIYP